MFQLKSTIKNTYHWEDLPVSYTIETEKELDQFIYEHAASIQGIENPCIRYWKDPDDDSIVYDISTSYYIKVKEIQ